MLKDLVERKRLEIQALAARHGAHKVRVFGSVARTEATVDSDVDFLVQMEPGRSLFDLVALTYDLEKLLGCAVDVVSEGGLSPHIGDAILAEAVPL